MLNIRPLQIKFSMTQSALLKTESTAESSRQKQEKNDDRLAPQADKREACNQIAKAASVEEMGAEINKLVAAYHRDGLQQARLSFWSALFASFVGTGIFLWAVSCSMTPVAPRPATKTDQKEITTLSTPDLSLIAGVVVQVIAGVNFYLYARTSRQLASYHICLERTNRFLLANSVCKEISEDKDKQNEMRSKLIETMLNAPMLTIEEVTGVVSKPSKDNQGTAGNQQ